MAFYHGIERLEIPGFRPIRLVRAGVIGLVGIAPAGPAQALTLVQNETDAAQFGKQVPGFTIPQALAAIFRQGAGTVLVVNVFDPETHTSTETDEAHTVAAGKITLDYAPIGAIVVKDDEDATVPTSAYSVDEFGVVTILDLTTYPNGTALTVTYDRLNASLVTNDDIIGEVDVDSTRTGAKLFYNSYVLYKFRPKILICPIFGEDVDVRDEFVEISEALFCRYLMDSSSGTTNAEAITNRSTSAEPFQTASKRVVLCHPRLLQYNSRTEENEETPFSQWLAGAWSSVIADPAKGYWFSPSNNQIKGVLGASGTVTFDPFNATGTDANSLNEAGIVTVGVDASRGPIVWGNRSAAYPDSTELDNFLPVLLTADVIDESVLVASLAFLDRPVTPALIDSVREQVNAFLRSQIALGALIDGKNEDGRTTGCYFDAAKNPAEQLAEGKVVFTLVYCPPAPAERITYDRVIDIQFLNSLTA